MQREFLETCKFSVLSDFPCFYDLLSVSFHILSNLIAYSEIIITFFAYLIDFQFRESCC